jgi:DegV family protein with EDD domain
MPVKIVTDSAADLSTEQAQDLGVAVVPLTIRFGDEEFVDGVDLTPQGFYDKMATVDTLPATAAPSPGAFEQAFRTAAADGDPVVWINLSSALSAPMQAAPSAARAREGEVDVRVVDSAGITASLGMKVIAAADAARSGAGVDEVVALVEALKPRTQIYGALSTLDNLKKGGRIGGAQAMIGSMLSIKPVIDISTGEVHEAGKPRTRGKALIWLRDRLFAEAEQPSEVAVCQGCAEGVEDLVELLLPRYSREQLSIWTVGPVIGAHGGPGILGLAWHRPA